MGYGVYSSVTRSTRATTMGYSTKSVNEIFTQRDISNEMSPKDVGIRESRDSEEHPNSIPIVIALDVTGSMGSIPHSLVKDGLPKMMEKIMQNGIPDPQVLFLAIGDHECDRAPLQVGQFESSDELLDRWLTTVYLEGGGGGNEGESYLLAWYFAFFHTATDNFEKRNKKGYLFTIGDEPTLSSVSGNTLQKIMGGTSEIQNITAPELLKKASEKYNCFHLHITETYSGQRTTVQNSWKELMSENMIMVKNKDEVANIIAQTIVKNEMHDSIDNEVSENLVDKPVEPIIDSEPIKTEDILL